MALGILPINLGHTLWIENEEVIICILSYLEMKKVLRMLARLIQKEFIFLENIYIEITATAWCETT